MLSDKIKNFLEENSKFLPLSFNEEREGVFMLLDAVKIVEVNDLATKQNKKAVRILVKKLEKEGALYRTIQTSSLSLLQMLNKYQEGDVVHIKQEKIPRGNGIYVVKYRVKYLGKKELTKQDAEVKDDFINEKSYAPSEE